jgi:formate dehydrogenase subunit gamma
MDLFRYATSVYGQTVLLGANWDLFYWFVGAAIAFVVLDIVRLTAMRPAPAKAPPAVAAGAPVERHKLGDRLYHWTMAAAVLTLMFTAFAPILGWKFEWLTVHWISGVVLAVLVVIHIVRAIVWQDFWAMMIAPADLDEVGGWFSRGGAAHKTGKYEVLQKLYHWGIAALVLAIICTGALMLLKIDTPFWRRDPYWFADSTWGMIYAVHGLCAMAAIMLVIIHIYFGLRPDKLWLFRSMISGRITRQDYLTHHDPQRWEIK